MVHLRGKTPSGRWNISVSGRVGRQVLLLPTVTRTSLDVAFAAPRGPNALPGPAPRGFIYLAPAFSRDRDSLTTNLHSRASTTAQSSRYTRAGVSVGCGGTARQLQRPVGSAAATLHDGPDLKLHATRERVLGPHHAVIFSGLAGGGLDCARGAELLRARQLRSRGRQPAAGGVVEAVAWRVVYRRCGRRRHAG